MYVPYHPAHTTLTPHSHLAQTPLTPCSHLAQVPFSRESRRCCAVANIHPTTNHPNFDWPWDPRPPASSSTMAVFIDDRPSEPRRIHHRQPSAQVWGPAVMYSRCSVTSPQHFVWQKVARGSSCFVVSGREVSSWTIGIAPQINKFDRIKLIVHYKYSNIQKQVYCINELRLLLNFNDVAVKKGELHQNTPQPCLKHVLRVSGDVFEAAMTSDRWCQVSSWSTMDSDAMVMVLEAASWLCEERGWMLNWWSVGTRGGHWVLGTLIPRSHPAHTKLRYVL
jgi:hypothetical protein